MDKRLADSFILCAGARFQPECAEVISSAAMDETLSCWTFLMSKWCSTDQFRSAALLWVVDDSQPWEELHLALTNSIPVLVPEDSSELKELCLKAGCGIYYRNASEARHCLKLLLTREALRSKMGQNG